MNPLSLRDSASQFIAVLNARNAGVDVNLGVPLSGPPALSTRSVESPMEELRRIQHLDSKASADSQAIMANSDEKNNAADGHPTSGNALSAAFFQASVSQAASRQVTPTPANSPFRTMVYPPTGSED